MPTPKVRQLDIIGFGALNLDYVVVGPTRPKDLDDLEQGTEQRVHDYGRIERTINNLKKSDRPMSVRVGGSALNTMRALVSLAPDLRLGFATVSGGTVKSLPDAPEWERLNRDLKPHVKWSGGHPGTCVSLLGEGKRTLLTYNNPSAVAMLGDPSVQSELADVLAGARLVHVTSFFGDAAPEDVATILELVKERRKDVRFSVDVGHVWAEAEAADRVLSLADHMFVNETELSLMASQGAGDREHEEEQHRAEYVLDKLCPSARRVVVLKRKTSAGLGDDYVGRTGATMYVRAKGRSRTERYEFAEQALPPGHIVDSTGAGDVFAAGVLASTFSPEVEAVESLRLGFTAARHKLQRPGIDGFQGLDRAVHRQSLMPGSGMVFVSHASADRPLVQALVRLLHAGCRRDDSEQFFCTTLPDHGPRASKGLRQQIWDPLRDAEFAVFVVTESFLVSRECAYEMGAAAVLGLRVVPLLQPGIKFANDLMPMADIAGGYLDNIEALAAAHEALASHYDYKSVGHGTFSALTKEVVDEAAKLKPVAPGQVFAFERDNAIAKAPKPRPAKKRRGK